MDVGVGEEAGELAFPFLLPPLIDTLRCDKRENGFGLEPDSSFPFLVMVRPAGVVALVPPDSPAAPTTEIPASLLSLFMLLLSLALPLDVLDIDTDFGNLSELPPCEIEIPAGNLGTLFGVALDAGSRWI